jgi:hypothetical protein
MTYIVAIHDIRDPDRFFGGQLDLPEGVQLHSIWPRGDRSKAVCLWEADTTEDVRSVLDSQVGDASVNELFEVDTANQAAMGLPTSAAAG